MSPREHFALAGATHCLDEVREVAIACATRPAEPELAAELWAGIVAGALSVVDTFNACGRRYVIARRNPRSLRGRLALTERQATMLRAIAEGRTNKELEGELNLRASTVSTHVTLLLAKLGVQTRAEVARRFACLAQLAIEG